MPSIIVCTVLTTHYSWPLRVWSEIMSARYASCLSHAARAGLPVAPASTIARSTLILRGKASWLLPTISDSTRVLSRRGSPTQARFIASSWSETKKLSTQSWSSRKTLSLATTYWTWATSLFQELPLSNWYQGKPSNQPTQKMKRQPSQAPLCFRAATTWLTLNGLRTDCLTIWPTLEAFSALSTGLLRSLHYLSVTMVFIIYWLLCYFQLIQKSFRRKQIRPRSKARNLTYQIYSNKSCNHRLSSRPTS